MRLIDADALKDLEEMEYIYFTTPAAVPFYKADDVWRVIEEAPTIEAEPVRHGRWIALGQRTYGGGRSYTHYCSECGQHGFDDYILCPNCGAKMQGLQDSKDGFGGVAMDGWHSIEEKPPEMDLIICCRQHCELVEYGGIKWHSLFGGEDTTIARCMGVTHWRPAPDAPREEKADA